MDNENKELNQDATHNYDLLRMGGIFNIFNERNGEEKNKILKYDDIQELFNSNGLVRKIVLKYPENARGTGFRILNRDGVCVTENDPVVLEGFYNTTIYARLYGYSVLAFNVVKSLPEEPMQIGDKLESFKISNNSTKQGDFFYINGIRYHHSKILVFKGDKKFRFQDPQNDFNELFKNQSILQTIYNSFKRLKNTSDSTRYIVDNLSYLLVGITNLTSLNNTEAGKTLLSQKMLALNRERSLDKIISYDLNKEQVNFINQSLGGLDEVLNQFKILLASETDYPYEQLFENSSGVGIGTGVQTQLVSRFLWQQHVQKWILNHWQFNYELLKNRLFGEEFKLEIPFNVELTITEKADLENTIANRNKTLIDAGIILPEEARVNYQGDTFDFNLKLDDAVTEEDKKVKISASSEDGEIFDDKSYSDNLPNNLGITFDSKGEMNLDDTRDTIPTNEEFDAIASVSIEDILGILKD